MPAHSLSLFFELNKYLTKHHNERDMSYKGGSMEKKLYIDAASDMNNGREKEE